MFKVIKRLLLVVVVLALAGTAIVYGVLTLSLPTLDGKGRSDAVTQPVKVARDTLGQAVITAATRHEAAYGLGYATGKTAFFKWIYLDVMPPVNSVSYLVKLRLLLIKKCAFINYVNAAKLF